MAGTYTPQIARTDSQALMPEAVSREIFQGVARDSVALGKMRRLPNIPRKQFRLPVLSALPTAYFVGEVTKVATPPEGLKQVTKAMWDNKYVNAEELAVIVPIPETVLDDVDYDIWGEIKPKLVEAFGAKLDTAIFFGADKPSSWPTGIVPSAIAAGNSVDAGSTDKELFASIMGKEGVLAAVEQDGYGVTGHAAHLAVKAMLRGMRDDLGRPLFETSLQEGAPSYALDGSPIEFSMNGSWDDAEALMISGDFSQAVYAYRQDLTYKVLDQAVIQDENGAIIYNLGQQDMVALRCTMRIGWQVPNPVNRLRQIEASRYPFAVLLPEGYSGS